MKRNFKSHKLTAERLREVLDYNPETGVFRWKLKIAKWIKIGEEAGTWQRWRGTKFLVIDKCSYPLHRLAWLYVHGRYPKRLKWKNGDHSDNRIENIITISEWMKIRPKHIRIRQKSKDKKLRSVMQRGKDKQMNKLKITVADYEKMVLEQKGCCAICDQPETQMRKGKPVAIAIDHCHDTGDIRGLLCHACNKMIGLAKDNPYILGRAINYLNKAKTKVSESGNVVFLPKKESI